MYYYHGTSLENAISILKQRQIKGRKAEQKHKNRYVSLTKNKLVARQFGEVVLRFDADLMDNVTVVDYANKQWVLENQEMVEFMLKETNAHDSEDKFDLIQKFKQEKEVILFNRYRFDSNGIDILLIDEDTKRMNEIKKELQAYVIDGDKVTKSQKLYEDFKNFI